MVEKVGKILGQLGREPRTGAGSANGRGWGRREVASFGSTRRQPDWNSHGSAAVADAPAEVSNDGDKVSQGERASERKFEYSPRRRRSGVATDLTKVKSILSKVLSHRGLDKKVERYGFILHWHEIVGERLAEVSKPECIVNGQLIVNVLHPAWAQELTMIKPVLLESLARFLRPGDVVRDMMFRVKPFTR